MLKPLQTFSHLHDDNEVLLCPTSIPLNPEAIFRWRQLNENR